MCVDSELGSEMWNRLAGPLYGLPRVDTEVPSLVDIVVVDAN